MKRFLNAVLLCYMKGKDNLIYLFIYFLKPANPGHFIT